MAQAAENAIPSGERAELRDLHLVETLGVALLEDDLYAAWQAGETLLGVDTRSMTDAERELGVETQLNPNRTAVFDNGLRADPITDYERTASIQDPEQRRVRSLTASQYALRTGVGVQRAFRRSDTSTIGPAAGIAVIGPDLRERIFTAPDYTAQSPAYGDTELGDLLAQRGYHRAYINQSPLEVWALRNPGPAAELLQRLLRSTPEELAAMSPTDLHAVRTEQHDLATADTIEMQAVGAEPANSPAGRAGALAVTALGTTAPRYHAAEVELTDADGRRVTAAVNGELAQDPAVTGQRDGGRHRSGRLADGEAELAAELAEQDSDQVQAAVAGPQIQAPPAGFRPGVIPAAAIARWMEREGAADGQRAQEHPDPVAAAELIVRNAAAAAGGEQDDQAASLPRREPGASGDRPLTEIRVGRVPVPGQDTEASEAGVPAAGQAVQAPDPDALPTRARGASPLGRRGRAPEVRRPVISDAMAARIAASLAAERDRDS